MHPRGRAGGRESSGEGVKGGGWGLDEVEGADVGENAGVGEDSGGQGIMTWGGLGWAWEEIISATAPTVPPRGGGGASGRG